jgi:TonB-dependent SusC/RagA subfamily outer membrane receptor
MKSRHTRALRPLIATATVLLVGAGCSQSPPIEGSAPVPLANPAGPRTDVLERQDMTIKVNSMEELIANRLPGVVVHRGRGGSWIEIRGNSSLSGRSEALIVIDGVQNSTRGLLAMNPDVVERIQVLKGASAAIYGLQGANGVVVVTTRR